MVNVLHRLEAELARPAGQEGRDAVAAWAACCPSLLASGVAEPGEIPGWVWTRQAVADDVLRVLVAFAQSGDRWALSTLLVCLGRGLCAVASGIGVPVDEVVSEATSVILDFPFARRRTVPGQVLLDTRKRFSRERERQLVRERPTGDLNALGRLPVEDRGLDNRAAPDGLGVDATAADRVSALVVRAWREGVLDQDQARLVLETRVWGVSVDEAAARRGITDRAVYCRRERAEARLAQVWL